MTGEDQEFRSSGVAECECSEFGVEAVVSGQGRQLVRYLEFAADRIKS